MTIIIAEALAANQFEETMPIQSDLILRAAETPDDIARLRAFIARHGAEATRQLDRHLARPRYRAAFTPIAERDGALLGYALIGHIRRRLGAATLEIGDIERIDLRGDQDVLNALIGGCLSVLLEHGLPLATIHGSAAVYTSFGFAPYYFTATANLGSDDTSLHTPLRDATESDLDDLAALYEASYRNLPLSEARAAPDWRAWLTRDRAPLALEDVRGRVIAYATIEEHKSADALSAAEAAAADAGAARGLIMALRARAQEQGAQRLSLELSPWHPVAQAALQMQGDIQIAAGGCAGPAALAGVVDLPGILEALVPEFERRLANSRYAGWSGNLRVEIETERITVALADGHATVIDGSRPADVRLRQIALPALAQLCLGYRAVADLRATDGLACDDSALGLLDVLFPVVLACGGKIERGAGVKA
jgi:hypothetical protein